MNILTARLELIPATAELMHQEISDPQALGQRLNAHIPAGWPPEEVRDVLGFFADQMDAGVTGNGWGIYYRVTLADSATPRTLIGSGGFMSKLNGDTVEVGYGTLEEFQERGYATEALPENPASVRVLEKNGFADAGPGQEAGTRRFERPR